MASITITTSRDPHRTRRLRAVALAFWSAFAALGRRAVTPHRAAAANIGRMPLTTAGLGCADYAAWHLGAGWGWLAIAASLVLLEHLIADEQ